MIRSIVTNLLLFVSFSVWAQKQTRSQYIDKYKQVPVNEMNKTGIPASITLAQGILESGDGNSDLATKANNHFGIKCHSSWTGKKYIHDDDKKDECFRVYKSAEESYRDHSDFLVNKSRYAFLFVLKPTNYKGWANGLKKAGYATNPKYPGLLIKLIEEDQLYNFDNDKSAIARTSKDDKSVKSNNRKPNKPAKVVNVKSNYNVYYASSEIKVSYNYIKYYTALGGDTYLSIANKFEMRLWQLVKYNDLQKDAIKPKSGDKIYLQPKRWKAFEKFHLVRSGDTVESVSQNYGLKQKWVISRNKLSGEQSLIAGKKIKLR